VTNFALTPAAVAAAGTTWVLDAPLADIRAELETNRFGTIRFARASRRSSPASTPARS
jgi:hypothetical protein